MNTETTVDIQHELALLSNFNPLASIDEIETWEAETGGDWYEEIATYGEGNCWNTSQGEGYYD